MIVSNNKTITVNNIQQRNSIELKTRGLRVIVEDAFDDIGTHIKAIYTWDTISNSWILDSETTPNVTNILSSNDVNLDTMQEIVDYIKALQNRIITLESQIETMKNSRYLSIIG